MRKHFVFVLAIAIIILTAPPTSATIVDSVNADKTPWYYATGNAGEVGYLYTPQFSYTLTGVKTKFGHDGPSTPPPEFSPEYELELEIYDGLPINGGALLRSATFSFQLTADVIITGGSFAPLELSTGEDYFIGFRLIECSPSYLYPGFPCNYADSGVSLPGYYGADNSGTYPTITTADIYPILMFEGVPEPATLLLVGLGGLMLRCKR